MVPSTACSFRCIGVKDPAVEHNYGLQHPSWAGSEDTPAKRAGIGRRPEEKVITCTHGTRICTDFVERKFILDIPSRSRLDCPHDRLLLLSHYCDRSR